MGPSTNLLHRHLNILLTTGPPPLESSKPSPTFDCLNFSTMSCKWNVVNVHKSSPVLKQRLSARGSHRNELVVDGVLDEEPRAGRAVLA